MKKFTLTISVDEDILKQAYLDRQDLIKEEDLPSISALIQQEFGWLEASGIFLVEAGDNRSFQNISWCIEDIQEVARDRFNSTISDEDAQTVLEFLFTEHDANVGINWDFIYCSLEHLLAQDLISLNPLTADDNEQ